MAGRALADYLLDFGNGPAPAAVSPVSPAVVEPQPPSVPDAAAVAAAEMAIAEARLRAEMNEAAQVALDLERERHAAEMAQLHAELGGVAGARIAAELAEAERRFTALVTTAAARILSSMLSDDLNRRSVDRLAAAIRYAVADRDAVRIRIVGPQSLFESLRGSLGPLAAQCDFTEAPGFDLSVTIDDALFETRLAEWSATIGEALS